MAQDPYELLGVQPNASLEEIEAAYRAALERYDPDRYPDPEQKADAIRMNLAIKTAYRKVRSQARQAPPTFHFADQVPPERAWAMQQGAPVWAPPPQPGEDVIIVGPEKKPVPRLLERPANWNQWRLDLLIALLGTVPLIGGLLIAFFVLRWVTGPGARSVAEWVAAGLGLLLAVGFGFVSLFPVYRVWLLLTRLRPPRRK
jgi:hypothetical protein